MNAKNIYIILITFKLNPQESLFQVNACGEYFIGNNVIAGKIVNGITAIPHSWPSIAKIVVDKGNGYTLHCGGTLIDNRTVLSAAQLRKSKTKLEIVAFIKLFDESLLFLQSIFYAVFK